jgi:hypothetical protein
MSESSVYQFAWWDRHDRKEVVSPRFATLNAIARCNGKVLEDSRLVVDSREIDCNGFYCMRVG